MQSVQVVVHYFVNSVSVQGILIYETPLEKNYSQKYFLMYICTFLMKNIPIPANCPDFRV